MGQTQATKEAIWLRRLINEIMPGNPEGPTDLKGKITPIYADNKGAIELSASRTFHQRTKHIDIQWHFCREQAAKGTVTFLQVPTKEQVADGLTKPLGQQMFRDFRKALGLEVH